jgi:lipopolysaccharide/colanic/teichoic acid biosynthesis glycosyltransferase
MELRRPQRLVWVGNQATGAAVTIRSDESRALDDALRVGTHAPIAPAPAPGSRRAIAPNAAFFSTLPGWDGEASIPLTPDRGVYQRAGKRALDSTLAFGAILILSPLLCAIAVAIKLEDGGPVFYRSVRVGQGGRRFSFWKFRSMIRNAESCRDRLQDLNQVDGPVFKIENDPRITRVGRWLRRSSLDELPQLWNIVRGDMSMVGPRPPIPEEVLKYEPWQLRRLSVRPGLTCLWQISGRCTIPFDEWMRLDMEYIDRRSFLLDAQILIRTIPAVLSGEGAY